MKKKNIKTLQHEENSWVDVYNDELMVKLGIRSPNLQPKDPEVWTKTPYEKKMLKSLRRIHKGRIHFHSVPHKSIPVRAKLIIQLSKNKIFPYTTYSVECWQHEIDNILAKYCCINNKTGLNESLVTKYIYNNKTYSINERPFWY